MPELLTPDDVADIVHTTAAQLAQMRYRGGGPRYVKFGKKILYRRTDIEAYIEANLYARTDQPVSA